jgi:hypothetical protein
MADVWRRSALFWLGVIGSLLWAGTAYNAEVNKWEAMRAHYLPIQYNICISADHASGRKRDCGAVAAGNLKWIEREERIFSSSRALATLLSGVGGSFVLVAILRGIGKRNELRRAATSGS